jgi:hypothetical protein
MRALLFGVNTKAVIAVRKLTKVLVDQDRCVMKVNGFEIDLAVLLAIVNPDSRVLWAFIRNGKRIQALPYDESKVIWLDKPE